MNNPITYKHIGILVGVLAGVFLLWSLITYPYRLKEELKPWIWQEVDGSIQVIYLSKKVFDISCANNIINYKKL